MSVVVHVPPLLQTLAGGMKQISVRGSTVGECLEAVVKLHPDIRKRLFTRGGKITRQAGPMKDGQSILAFVQDPDGYAIELLSPGRKD